jgi:DNA-directed RNA polymerase subunit F
VEHLTNTKVASETPVMMAELKEELQRIKKRDEALNFRAEKTEEYLEQFASMSEKEAKELYKKIDTLDIPRLRAEHIVKLVDLLPTTSEEVKIVLQGYTVTLTKENLKRVADAITESTNKEKKE